MGPIRDAKARLALCLSAVTLVAFAGGCGAGVAQDTTAIETISDTYGETLAGRYDEVFPDDHVLTVRISMAEADLEAMQADVTAKEYYRADILIDGELLEDVAVRTKGNSSLMQAARAGSLRAGLKVDFNFFNSARNYHGLKKLCYSNGFSDPTLMKEFLSYEIMAAMGIPTPKACFADLWVNDTHLGVYTQVEAVDASFVDEHFADGNGNLYKPEIPAGKLDWTEADAAAQTTSTSSPTTDEATSASTTTTESFNLGGGNFEQIIDRLGDDVGWIPGRLDTTEDTEASTTTTSLRQPGDLLVGFGVNSRSSDYLTAVGLRTNEDRADYSRLYDLLEIINSDPAEVSADDLEEILDVDEILRYLAVSAAIVHLDNYIGMGHNYYLYDNGGRFSIIPWDLNMSFGGFDSGLERDELVNFFLDEPTSAALAGYPLVEQLVTEPEYLEIYHAYLQELIEGPFSVERMTARIGEIADLIRPYVEADESVSLEQFEQGLTEDIASNGRTWNMGGTFIGLASFVEARTASIAAQLSGERDASNGDGSGNRGATGVGRMGGDLEPGGGLKGEGWPADAPGGGQMPAPPGEARPPATTTSLAPTDEAGGG